LISHCQNHLPFIYACGSNFDLAQWIYSLGDVNIHAQNDYAFRNACCEGHIEIAHWLYYDIGQGKKINIQVCCNSILQSTIKNGHIEVAQWLYSIVEDFHHTIIQVDDYQRAVCKMVVQDTSLSTAEKDCPK
jgi:hypothetical protein